MDSSAETVWGSAEEAYYYYYTGKDVKDGVPP